MAKEKWISSVSRKPHGKEAQLAKKRPDDERIWAVSGAFALFVTKGATRRDTLMATERLAVSGSPRRSMRARHGRRLLIAPTSNLMM
ncbi:hypothetical protein EHO51_17930 (plasmid) [Methylocystis rosea]|uniref:Uncharacterized protein n=1 Tax=Methylocystis rosea TaxID=173366 RepID=A0A3G8MA97_9HYPH|nr:hypothetical protein EHO51_17930 [Methylocystis rosea]